MKKISALTLAALMIFSAVALISCANTKGGLDSIADYVIANYVVSKDCGEFTYADAVGETAIITKFSVKSGVTEVDMSATDFKMNDRAISGIGDQAFYYCTSVTSIKLPSTIKSIGNFAFAGCESLEEIRIPASVQSIGKEAFQGCKSLKRVIFETGELTDDDGNKYTGTACTSIGKAAFADCVALESFGAEGSVGVVLPASLTTLGEGAFLRCGKLTAVEFNDALLSVGEQAFYKCERVQKVVFPDNQNLTEKNLGDSIFTPTIKPVLEEAAARTSNEAIKKYVEKMVYRAPETEAETTAESAT